MKITTTGEVSGGDDGMRIHNAGSSLTISAADVSGGNRGIYVGNDGSGALSVTTTGQVTGATGDGIVARNSSSSTDLTISTASVSGALNGIGAINYGSGALSISADGGIAGDNNGIWARSSSSGGLSITTSGAVSGTNDGGIYARNQGGGSLEITSTGEVSSTSGRGIYALNEGADLTISAAAVSGYGDGIRARNLSSGTLSITASGDVTGETGHGIYALGVGDASVTTSGDVTSNGIDADGVQISGGDDFTSQVAVLSGMVEGGTGNSAGVRFIGPADSIGILDVSTGGTVLSQSGTAVIGLDGIERVNNAGLIIGDVDLGAGVNAFDNLPGGRFESGASVNVGAGNALMNAGTVTPGGDGVVQTTVLTGDLQQTASGTLALDIDLDTGEADFVEVSGTADLAGTVRLQGIQPFSLTDLGDREQSYTVLTAEDGTTNSGLQLSGLNLSPAFDASLLFPNATDVVLGVSLDFADIPGLNANQSATGTALNAAFTLGIGDVEPVMDGLLAVSGLSEYKDAMDQLGTEIYGTMDSGAFFASQDFAAGLLSCAQSEGAFAAIAEGSCVWIEPQYRRVDRDTTSERVGYSGTASGLSGGAQFEVAPNWFLGSGVSFESGDISTSSGAGNNFDRYQGGVAVKYVDGPLLLAASLSGGISDSEVTRFIDFGGFTGTTTSEPDTTFVTALLRAAYLKDFGDFYAKPMLDLGWTSLDRDGVTESGAGAADLSVEGESSSYFAISPSVEFGKDVDMRRDQSLRVFARVGATYLPDQDHSATASFVNAPAGVEAFSNTIQTDQLFGDIELGATLFQADRYSLSASYQGRFSENTNTNFAGLKFQFNF